jgi:hypothetical protein
MGAHGPHTIKYTAAQASAMLPPSATSGDVRCPTGTPDPIASVTARTGATRARRRGVPVTAMSLPSHPGTREEGLQDARHVSRGVMGGYEAFAERIDALRLRGR